MQSFELSQPYKFEKYHLNDYLPSEKELRNRIIYTVQELTPNHEHSKNYLNKIKSEIMHFNIDQLFRVSEVVDLLSKYVISQSCRKKI